MGAPSDASDRSATDKILPMWMTDARKRFEKVFNAANQNQSSICGSSLKNFLDIQKIKNRDSPMRCAPNSFLTGCNAIACGTRHLRWIRRLSLALCGEGGGKCCNQTGVPPKMVTGHLCAMAQQAKCAVIYSAP